MGSLFEPPPQARSFNGLKVLAAFGAGVAVSAAVMRGPIDAPLNASSEIVAGPGNMVSQVPAAWVGTEWEKAQSNNQNYHATNIAHGPHPGCERPWPYEYGSCRTKPSDVISLPARVIPTDKHVPTAVGLAPEEPVVQPNQSIAPA